MDQQDVTRAVSRSTFWGLATSLLSAYFLLRRILAWRRLRHIPGPQAAGWTNLWLIHKTWQAQVFKGLGKVCEQFGECLLYLPRLDIHRSERRCTARVDTYQPLRRPGCTHCS